MRVALFCFTGQRHMICWFIFFFSFLSALFPVTVQGTAVCLHGVIMYTCMRHTWAYRRVHAGSHECIRSFVYSLHFACKHVGFNLSVRPFVCIYKCSEAEAKLCTHNITAILWPSLKPQLEMERVRGVESRGHARAQNWIARIAFNPCTKLMAMKIGVEQHKNTLCVQINVLNGGLWGCPLWMDTHMHLETRPKDYLHTHVHTHTLQSSGEKKNKKQNDFLKRSNFWILNY